MRNRKTAAACLAAIALALCLSGCQGGLVALQEESRQTVQMAGKEQGVQEVQSISEGNYAYERLSQEEKLLYDAILNAILLYQKEIELPVVDAASIERAYHAINCDYGGLFWVNGYTYTTYYIGDHALSLRFALSFTMEEGQKRQYQQQIDQAVDEWLQGISIQDSDYDKARYVFENLIRRVDYREDAPNSQNILSVFLGGETVCQGYACAAQYLLRHLGIPSMVVTGSANNEAHAWNIVLLDGEYYHMDATWGNSSYLNHQQQENKYINYNYMCMTDSEILATHQMQMDFPMPACVSVENNYFVREGCYFECWEPERMGALFRQAWSGGQDAVAIKCSDEALYRKVMDYFIKNQRIVDYCEGMPRICYMESPESCVLTVNFQE